MIDKKARFTIVLNILASAISVLETASDAVRAYDIEAPCLDEALVKVGKARDKILSKAEGWR